MFTRQWDLRPMEGDDLDQVLIPLEAYEGETLQEKLAEEEIPEEVIVSMEAEMLELLRMGTMSEELEKFAKDWGLRFTEQDGVYMDQYGRHWVPNNLVTRRGLIREYHDELQAGHPGIRPLSCWGRTTSGMGCRRM
jgi:hypothetical protein